MKAILYVIMLVGMLVGMLVAPSLASTIHSELVCNNSGTTMVYSYLKEPVLQDSDYTRGLKTGSFHYLVGNTANLEDRLMYYDGLVDTKHPREAGVNHNASLTHDIEVDFQGEKGISEYFAKGFFPNNRAVSAFKKVWYVDFYDDVKSSNYRGIYNYLPSDTIKIEGKVGMGPTSETGRETDYDFKYNAKINNGILEIWDATGFTNKTGSRRIDWEQSGIMKGKSIDVINNLLVEGIYIPGAGGGEDWLPCCYNGQNPPIEPIEPLENRWPTVNELAVLYPEKLLPQVSCSKGKCTSIQCQPPGKCDNFECIYTYGDLALSGVVTAASLTQIPSVPEAVKGGPSIDVYSDLVNDSNTANYSITVANTGKTLLQGVILVDILPMNTVFVTSEPEPTKRPDSQSLSAYWNLESLSPGEKRKVTLVLSKLDNFNPAFEKNAVYAEGTSAGNRITSGLPKESIRSSPSVEVASGFDSSSPADAIYKIVVTNSGRGLLDGVTLVDILPDNTTVNISKTEPKPDELLNVPSPRAKWNLGVMSPGEFRSVNLKLDRLNNASPEYETNMVQIEARSGETTIKSEPEPSLRNEENVES